ncbi:MAG: hypothetical protein J5854_06490 [Clostridia bacterium]|nr:hypothetical protein [Clostridia bacterium]
MARGRRRIVIRDSKKTALRLAFVVLILIATAGLAVFLALSLKSCGTKLSIRTMPLQSSELSEGTGDGLLYVRDGMLNFYNYKDENGNFAKYLSGTPTGIAGTDGIKAVWSENSVQIIDAPFDIAPGGRIKALRAGSMHVAVCIKKNNGDETVTVYNSAGQQVWELEFAEGSLVDFGFSEVSGRTLWTMELSVNSGSPRTTITTYDLSRMSATGVINVAGQLVERVCFTGSSVFVIGTETLVRYSSSTNREIYRVQLHGFRVTDIAMDGANLRLLLMPRNGGSASTVRILTVEQKDVANESALTLTLDDGLVSCHLLGGNLIAVWDGTVRLYDKKGKTVETLSLPVGSTLASKKLDDKHILLERSGEFDLLTLGK